MRHRRPGQPAVIEAGPVAEAELASPAAIEALFNPRGIVFVGLVDATERDVERSARLGKPFCYVNPKARGSLSGRPVYASLADVPADYDVAIIRLGAAGVPEAVQQCADHGIRRIFVFASGFAESGDAGRVLQDRLAEVVRRTGVLLVGPNTTENALEPRPLPEGHRGGLIGLITHSGGQGRAIVEGTAIGAGFSRWVALGNEVGLDAADLINYFAHDPRTAVIAAYVEGFKSGPKLRAALRAANECNKPVVVLKIGSTRMGAEMATSHTGHMAGADAPVDGLFEQHGVTRVRDLDQLVETANLFARLPAGTGTRCVLYSFSGANVAIMAEVAESFGIGIPPLAPDTQEALQAYFPPNVHRSNPIDNGGIYSASKPLETRLEALDRIAADPGVDLIVFGVGAAYPYPAGGFAEELAAWAPRASKPVLAVYSSPEMAGATFADTLRSGAPLFRSFTGCFGALAAWERHARHRAGFRERRSLARPLGAAARRALRAPGVLSARAAGDLLAEARIPLAREELATSQEAACEAAQAIGMPVAMKLMSADFPHKSDVGLLALNVSGVSRVRATYRELMERARHLDPKARIDGVLIQEQVGSGVEVIIGVTRDPLLGPALTIGAGGVYAEIFGDAALRPLPVDADDIREMLAGLKVSRLLAGARGSAPADVDALVALALRVAALAESAGGRISELDLNPVIVQPHRAIAVDALIVAAGISSAPTRPESERRGAARRTALTATR